MGAAQQQRPCPRGLHWGQRFLHSPAQGRVLGAGMPALDQGNEVRAGQINDLPAGGLFRQGPAEGAGLDAGCCGDDAQGRPARNTGHGFDAWIQYAADRQGIALQNVGCVAGHGAAGGDDGLGGEGGQQVQILPGHDQQLLPAFFPIGHPGAVGKINDVFFRHQPPQGHDCREAAQAGIKNSNRSVIH